MLCNLYWQQPHTPGPDIAFDEQLCLPWIPDLHWWYANTPGYPDHAQIWFDIDIHTGCFMVYITGWRNSTYLARLVSYYFYTDLRKPIDFTLTTPIGMPPASDVKTRFRANYPTA